MTNSAKTKGDSAEREAAKLLSELTGWNVRRKLGAGRADDTGDLEGVPQATIQVKSYRDQTRAVRETLDELPEQQANAGTTFAAGLIRRPGGRWFAVLTLEQLATLLREATGPVCPFHGPNCVADPREGQDFDWHD
jgi:Holliday junction resolvase